MLAFSFVLACVATRALRVAGGIYVVGAILTSLPGLLAVECVARVVTVGQEGTYLRALCCMTCQTFLPELFYGWEKNPGSQAHRFSTQGFGCALVDWLT